MSLKNTNKIGCINPTTGRKMNIDANIYDLFSKAIYHELKETKYGITYTDLVNGIKKCFKEKKTVFKGSVGWYAATVKKEWLDALIPGIPAMPSGVWAVGRAQEHGCGYCYV